MTTALKQTAHFQFLLGLASLLGFLFTTAAGSGASVDKAQKDYDRGKASEAAAEWEKALLHFRSQGDTKNELSTSVSLASAYQVIGQHRRALQLLENAYGLSIKPADANLKNLVRSRLGAALTMTREYERSDFLLREALDTDTVLNDRSLATAILNDIGNLFSAQKKVEEALAAYGQSAGLAREMEDRWMTAKALCNAAATAAQAGNARAADNFNTDALVEIGFLSDDSAKAFLLLSAAQTDALLKGILQSEKNRLLLRAHGSLTKALKIAETLGDSQLETYGLGFLAQLYEQDSQPDAALRLTRRAIFAGQKAQLPEALYRWEWLLGRLLKEKGDWESALGAYRRAVDILKPIRNDVSLGSGNSPGRDSFRESEGPLFFELADLILRKADVSQSQQEEQKFLLEARDTIEQLKVVELEDYFCDDCVDVVRSKGKAVETVDEGTAVVYFIPFPDRTETLVGLTAGIKRFTSPVGADGVTREVRKFRRHLETRTSYEYLKEAQTLYRWLIQPLDDLLHTNKIHTLVFVPDGSLRTIPFAGLHDGERFLIEKYALAVAPGLTLVEPRPFRQERATLLLSGVSEAVQGFPPLQFVSSELETIAPLYKSKTLLDASFTLEQLQHRLRNEQYSIVHIASHGQFDREAQKTFVLTHDSKLTLNGLESVIRPAQYRGRPVELLVLSACQTAAGDDRAALGLAGVAVKAGARSALATLWFVNDQSTSTLITEVYRQFSQFPRLSKAQALQAAQVKLLNDRRYRHPCYWSPYLMIGNWL